MAPVISFSLTKGVLVRDNIDPREVLNQTFTADIAFLSSSFGFLSGLAFWVVGIIVLDFFSEKKEAAKEANYPTAKTPKQTDFLKDTPWFSMVLVPLGVTAMTFNKLTIWNLSRATNLPKLRAMIFGPRANLQIQKRCFLIANATAFTYASGVFYYNFSFPRKPVTKEIDWETMPALIAWNAALASIGVLYLAPGIIIGSVLGGVLLRRRFLATIRKLQQQIK
eukprot:TRINITY_DN217_c0_g1_i2.p1 TRINITY_DN217_c0_g1~~TRINITY_DN217_c0_g1_i2.p1  ORF type:complete len:223 (-),score=33.96 TRINITY_DN217_c0_g1_i2:47-715(-)